ncbi:tripartite tricarboxylate transporter TctB family protein [Salipaludibacillus daqingensis]|uniref:tripartite tricarboxylate transporter TctB family protein n=1 Tax=Salipaludibacillus daqingensis TaxID=3041001 RepID=UPI00247301FC|nr:tripartite tricarboxylate transporter TctB family protein [Salipaludibacillus daqingensis]
MNNSDKTLSIVLFLFSVFMFMMSFAIPENSLGSGISGPSFFPQMWAIILASLSIILFFKSRRKEEKGTHKGFLKSLGEYKKVFYMLIASLGYIFMLDVLGYLLTTLLFLITTISVLSSEVKLKKTYIFIVSSLITATTYFIFAKLLNVFLPTGIIF